MSKDHDKTVRIQRASRVAEDDRGRNVWVGRVESTELELVSTDALQKVLKTADGKTKVEIRRLADSRKDGVLARDAATGHYQIVGDDQLQSMVGTGAVSDRPKSSADVTAAPLSEQARAKAEELSLVSTQLLRKILKQDGTSTIEKAGARKKDKSSGFDPYNNN